MPRIASTLGLLLFFALMSMLGASPARAEFGNCDDPNYLAKFDERFAGSHDFLCTEVARVDVNSDAGPSGIRVIQHLNGDWAGEAGSVAEIVHGVSAAAAAMPRLGSFRMQDTTILLVDGWALNDRREVWDGYGGYADFTPGDECHITIYMLGPAGRASYAASIVAHELFHCVQRASLTQEQIATSNAGAPGGGTWWIEGSAEWFATLALPAPPYENQRVDAFDAESPDRRLDDMAYESYPFFAWLGGVRGATGLMPFMHQMASDFSPRAQQAAMTAVLPAEDWLHFAEDYLDQNIHDGQGASIGSTPQDGDTLEWNETRTERIVLHPFTIVRRNLTMHCGRWGIAPRPSQAHAAKPATSSTWNALPSDIDNLDNGGHGDFRFVGFNATASDVNFQLAVTRTAECAECGGSHEVDACMVGDWRMTTDGAEAWMREHLPNFHGTVSASGNVIKMRSNGTFGTGVAQTESSGTLGGAAGYGQLTGQAAGRWSTSGGMLNMCYDAASGSGTVRVMEHGHLTTVPVTPHVPAVSSTRYSCSGNTFTQTMPMGTHGEVTSIYTRGAP